MELRGAGWGLAWAPPQVGGPPDSAACLGAGRGEPKGKTATPGQEARGLLGPAPGFRAVLGGHTHARGEGRAK